MYTKGDWRVNTVKGIRIESASVAKCICLLGDIEEEDQANAQRIVDCINGCKDIQNPLAAKDLYEALESWGNLRAMHPLDSGCDIDAILKECSAITDKALAKADGGK